MSATEEGGLVDSSSPDWHVPSGKHPHQQPNFLFSSRLWFSSLPLQICSASQPESAQHL